MIITLQNRIRPEGKVVLPPSKSETIRAALLLRLSGEDPERSVAGFGAPYCSDVCDALLAAKELKTAYVGESAALMRFMIPVQAALFGRVTVSADEVLYSRGLKEIEDCFGVSLERIPGSTLIHKKAVIKRKTRFEIDCSRSSQFLSGLLIALPLLRHDCEIIVKNGLVSSPYADMTLDFVRLFGGRIERTREGFITHPSRYTAPEALPVSGDASYAAVFEAMNLLGGRVEIVGAGGTTRQPDRDFMKYAGRSDIDVTHCPDLLPLLAAAACGRNGDTLIRGTARLRTKESDRESGTVELIKSLGGSARIGENMVAIRGTGRLRGGVCDPLGDHRLAFAASVMAMICDEPVTILGAECVKKSGIGFRKDMEGICGDQISIVG